jgi:hypothetical protein
MLLNKKYVLFRLTAKTNKMEVNTIYKGDCFELIKQLKKEDNSSK